MGEGVTPLIPWPQEALTPPFFLAKTGKIMDLYGSAWIFPESSLTCSHS